MTINDINLLSQAKDTYGIEYEKHLFEEYKLYVELTDRISSRRMLANSFFLALQTALVIVSVVVILKNVFLQQLILIIPLLIFGLICLVWVKLIISYKQLNTGRFKVILELEKMLPVAPYTAEWNILKEGTDTKIYKLLTDVEKLVPILFLLLYIFLICVIIFKSL
jgi:hypothetical protein